MDNRAKTRSRCLGRRLKIDARYLLQLGRSARRHLTGLKASDFVEVSGMTAADGTITATAGSRRDRLGRNAWQVLGNGGERRYGQRTPLMINALIVELFGREFFTGFTSGQPAKRRSRRSPRNDIRFSHHDVDRNERRQARWSDAQQEGPAITAPRWSVRV